MLLRSVALPLAAAIFAVLAGAKTSSAESLFVAYVHVLTAKGTYEKLHILSTAQGVGRVECEMRKDAWLAEHKESIEYAKAEMAKQGKHTEMTVTCEPKPGQ